MTAMADLAASLRLSIVVPVYNSPRELAACLDALRADAPTGAELIVVDDASTDDSADVARAAGARVLRLARNGGPAAARNHGARHARGDVLLFVDADVVVRPRHGGASDRVASSTIRRSPPSSAPTTTRPARPGLVSQYRNLLHHFVHQQGRADASTFWAGCGAVRRAAFVAVGGFDDVRFARPSIEDIELGYRLRRAGHRIRLDKDLQGTHLKRWTLGSMMRTDVDAPGAPWARLILETANAPVDLNLNVSQRVSSGLAGVAVLGLLLRLFVPPPAWASWWPPSPRWPS